MVAEHIWAGLLMFTMWSYDNLFLDLVMWLLLGGISFWALVIFYHVCFQFRGRAQTNRGFINALLGHNVLRLHVPPQIACVARGRLQGLKIKLSVLDREPQDLENATLREVRDIPEVHPCSLIPSTNEEEINALPVHKHKVTVPKSESSSAEKASTSLASAEGAMNVDVEELASEEESTCYLCLGRIFGGEPRRTLPCLHQFHTDCMDPWMFKRALCPVCKIPRGLALEGSMEGAIHGANAV